MSYEPETKAIEVYIQLIMTLLVKAQKYQVLREGPEVKSEVIFELRKLV